jgi:hypothetical protein
MGKGATMILEKEISFPLGSVWMEFENGQDMWVVVIRMAKPEECNKSVICETFTNEEWAYSYYKCALDLLGNIKGE